MKISEIIYRIQSLYSKGVPSDDNRLSNRQVYNKLLTVRARLISQENKKKQRVSRWNYQTISCLELIEVSGHECPCLPPVGCNILRSKYQLPKPLTGLDKHLIESVTTVDRSIKLIEVVPTAVKYQGGNKYTSQAINYYIHNNYLYVTTPTKIRLLTLVGLFEDPIEVEKFVNYCKERNCVDCNNNQAECIDYLEEFFPIDNDMIDTLIELSLQELIGVFQKGVNDIYNDSREVNTQ